MDDREIGIAENLAFAPATEDTELIDTKIQCIDCSKDFVWTAGEQAFFRDKKLENPPKRCKVCKKAKNERLAAIENAPPFRCPNYAGARHNGRDTVQYSSADFSHFCE